MAHASEQSGAQPTQLSYKPYIPAETQLLELSFKAVLLGVIMSVILGAANAYLGLKAGMTVAATFPAAVVSMAVLRAFRSNILEENLARTTGAVGEALAAGAIFTLPAFIMTGVWSHFTYWQATSLMLVGGILGVLLVIVLRRTLVEDTSLPYPESVACAEVVKAGQAGATGAGYLFSMIGLAGAIEFFKNPNGLQIIDDRIRTFVSFHLSRIRYLIEGREIGSATFGGGTLLQTPLASPAVMGVGYIIGPRLAAITFSGGVFGWLFLMPLVMFLQGTDLAALLAPGRDWATVARAAYDSTVKPVAVGAMLVGAFNTLFRMRTRLIGGIKRGLADMKVAKMGGEVSSRIERDAPFLPVFLSIGVLVVIMVFLYQFFTQNWGASLVSAIVMGAAGFLFAAVAGYLVGLIGSSSNPISGLTLSTLLIAAVLMVVLGMTGPPGIAAVLGVATVVCCVAGVAGDMMQDWKVGHILGATPWRMQIGGMIGVVAAALILVFPLIALHRGTVGGIGGEALPAPQAGLMAMMTKGIVGGEMAWPLVGVGMLFSIGLILINSPSPMLIAVGMYLPFATTFAIFTGGVVKFILDRLAAKRVKAEGEKERVENTGILLASGMVAGEALMGILLAILVWREIRLPSLLAAAGPGMQLLSRLLALVVIVVLAYILIRVPLRTLKKSS